MPNRMTCLVTAALACPLLAQAQVTMKPDGQWRSLFTLGASLSSGNTRQTNLSFAGDLVRLRDFDKWSFNGQAQYARSAGAETADRVGLTGLYTRDLTPTVFGFGNVDFLRDEPGNLSSRASVAGGLGLHLLRGTDHTWDVSTGLGYTQDRFEQPDTQDGVERLQYSHADVLLSEESTHKFSPTTSFRQKLSVYPNLNDRSDYRAVFDTGLSVAMTQLLSLTATLSYRYDSRPAEGFGSSDTLFVTGVSLRFD